MKILVIDDDAASLAATKSMLEQSPLVDKAEIANNMDDLSASLRADPPDAVLVDVEMASKLLLICRKRIRRSHIYF